MVIIGATHLIKYKRHENSKRAPRKKMRAYAERDELLETLGYGSYQEYLQGDDWKEIRERKLALFPVCLLCDRKASQVHHLDYDFRTLLGMEPKFLVTLCEDCHREIEFDGEAKRGLFDANKILRRLAQKTKAGRRWCKLMKREYRTRLNEGRAMPPGVNINKDDKRWRGRIGGNKPLPWRGRQDEPRRCRICRKNPPKQYRMVCRACAHKEWEKSQERKARGS